VVSLSEGSYESFSVKPIELLRQANVLAVYDQRANLVALDAVLGAEYEDPYVRQGYKVGAVDYFSKPFDPEILKVKVGIYASFRQRADPARARAPDPRVGRNCARSDAS
jgi:hypothetical protein